jgi:hypothetical protein
MIKRYLIPIDKDARKDGSDGVQPKYLDLLTSGTAKGIIPKETTSDWTNRTWLRDHYIVEVDTKDQAVFTALEKQADVVLLAANIDVAKITAAGVDTSSLNAFSTATDKEKAVVSWLTTEAKSFSQVF